MSFQAAGARDRAATQGIFVILLVLSILSFAFTVPLSERYRASPIAAGRETAGDGINRMDRMTKMTRAAAGSLAPAA